MNEDILYSIEDLCCSYQHDRDKPILVVNKLDILSKKLIVILGESGSGKTTLLQTLAMMNNTLAPGSRVLFYPIEADSENSSNGIDFYSTWKQRSEKLISEIRKRHFSFIFQETRLMSNLNVYENIALTGLIQKKENKYLQKKILSFFESVKLNGISFRKDSLKLSGGEKQRVAFLQAVTADYSILFGDEPTGSLDEHNEKKIIEIIKGEVDAGKSAILVSHNIDLALDHADQIILLQKDKGEKVSYIDKDKSVLKRDLDDKNNWLLNGLKLEKSKAKSEIKRLINIEHPEGDINYDKALPSFFWLLLHRETKVLVGLKNVLISLIIAFLTIGAIGSANGELEFLAKQQNNPILKQIVLPVSNLFSDSETNLKSIESRINKKKKKGESLYGLRNVTGGKYYELALMDNVKKDNLNAHNNSSRLVYGRTVNLEKDSLILNYIYEQVGAKTTLDETETGLIVTKKLLEKLHYPINSSFVFLKQYADTFFYTQLPIICVVDKLPGDAEFFSTESFENNLHASDKFANEARLLPRKYSKRIVMFLSDFRKDKSLPISDSLRVILRERNLSIKKIYYNDYNTVNIKGLKVDIQLDSTLFFMDRLLLVKQIADRLEKTLYTQKKRKNTYSKVVWRDIVDKFGYNDSVLILRSTDSVPYSVPVSLLYKKMINRLSSAIKNDENLSFNYVYPLFQYDLGDYSDEERGYNLLILNFDNFDQIMDFDKKYFQKEFANYELDFATLQEKYVFQLISNIASKTSWIIIILGAVGVAILFASILSNHLDKISVNLGNYLAFGLYKNWLYVLYSLISCGFAVAILGGAMLMNLLLQQFIERFILWNSFTGFAIGGILLTTLVSTFLTLRVHLSKTPGELIYGRNKE